MDQLTIYQGDSHLPQQRETANLSAAMSGLSIHTQRAYERWIRRYMAAILMADYPLDIQAAPVELMASILSVPNLKAWLGTLKAQGLGRQSLNQARAAVVWLAGHMADLGHLDYGEAAGIRTVKLPKAEVGQRQGTWLSQEEIARLLMACQDDTPVGLRNTALVTLLVTCGLRRDEIASATWDDYGTHGKYPTLRVHGKGEKLRIVKLPRMTVRALDAWKKRCQWGFKARGVMFPAVRPDGAWREEAISDREVWNIVKGCAARAGFPDVSPHDLRRSMARGAYESGATMEEIRQALGHSSVQTTEKYINSVLELERAATDIWADRLEQAQGEK